MAAEAGLPASEAAAAGEVEEEVTLHLQSHLCASCRLLLLLLLLEVQL